jgi:hypothetical protein
LQIENRVIIKGHKDFTTAEEDIIRGQRYSEGEDRLERSVENDD